jgi:diguanylate cyclase (GGDEF)-like protein/PAS domain S-box-containing protein
VIVAVLIAIFLARRLTRSLDHLIQVTKQVELGQRDVRSTIDRGDEVGQLANSFNVMLDTLHDSELNLNRINRLYAAWVECNEITAHEGDGSVLLIKICQVLVERVPFELACIGVAEEDSSVSIIASAGTAAHQLGGVNISVNAHTTEGQGPLGTAIREGKPKIFNDFLNVSESALWGEMAVTNKFCSAAAFPIIKSGQCFGGIAVYSATVNFFTAELISLMSGLADDISFTLTNIDLERQRLADLVHLERAAKVFEHSKEAILVTDSNNQIISVNRSFTDITGYLPEDALGKTPKMLSSGRHDADFYKNMWDTLYINGSWQGEIWNKRKNGEIYPEDLTLICVNGYAGTVINYIAIFSDISERKSAENRIQQLAHYDVLTGLPNRLLFNDRLEQALISAQRNQTTIALLFLDLDRFKNINDTLGHDAGDQLLQMVAGRLMKCVREQDTVSRQGGDEFVALLPGSDAAGAALVAQKMLELIIQPYSIMGHDLRISTSIGFALYPEQAIDADTLIKYADVAMYQAKEGGRNKYLQFNPNMNSHAYERLNLENNLRVALEKNQFQLNYQPQVNLADGRIIGCEALIRWHHPEMGMVSPANFIPLAEETGLIGPISDWVLKEALSQCQQWRNAGLPDISMAVNLSALQFRDGNLQEQVSRLLAEYAVPPQFLDLELTEGILMQGVERTLIALHELTALGVGISIDDFGTGYSSLSYLKRFPIHKIKIDQSFVRDITVDSSDASMVETIIVMAHSLKMGVIAEGVETKEQAAFLLQAGCEHAQGYLFGRPMPAEEFAEKLRQNTAL